MCTPSSLLYNCVLNAYLGKSCFLYYLLFRLLSEQKPVALQLFNHFILFQDNSIHRHGLKDYLHDLPKGTWALADSNEHSGLPCSTFLDVTARKLAWIVQTTSPRQKIWKLWSDHHFADSFIMECFSIDEILALGWV